MEAEIEGGINVMQLLWNQHSQEDYWGFILIDAHNVFNEENWESILWYVQFEYPSGMKFTLDCYHHWYTLLIRDMGGTSNFLHNK